MSARFVILLGVVLALAAVLYVKKSAAPTAADVATAEDLGDGLTDEELALIRVRQTLLSDRHLPGEEPPDPPELSVQIEVDTSKGHNSLCAYITEAHGYYVETFQLDLWYKGRNEVTGAETRRLVFRHYIPKYLRAADTLQVCFEVVPTELQKIGGDIGASENWDATIASYGRARLENPDPLPPL